MKRAFYWVGLSFWLFFDLTCLAYSQGTIVLLPPDGTFQQSDSEAVSNLWLPDMLSFSGASSSNYVGNMDGITLQIIPTLYDYSSNDLAATLTPRTFSIGPSRPILSIQGVFDQPILVSLQWHHRGFLRRIRARKLLLALERDSSSSADLSQQLILMEFSREKTAGQVTGGALPPGFPVIIIPAGQNPFETPEPTSLGLIGLGGALLILRKTRKRSSG